MSLTESSKCSFSASCGEEGETEVGVGDGWTTGASSAAQILLLPLWLPNRPAAAVVRMRDVEKIPAAATAAAVDVHCDDDDDDDDDDLLEEKNVQLAAAAVADVVPLGYLIVLALLLLVLLLVENVADATDVANGDAAILEDKQEFLNVRNCKQRSLFLLTRRFESRAVRDCMITH